MVISDNQLAWELADRLRSWLNSAERASVFVDLGSGDERAAIDRLLHIAAARGMPLSPTMVGKLRVWARVHDEEKRYAAVLAEIESARARLVGIAATRSGMLSRR